MFNNIIYFVLVLLIFSITYPETSSEDSFGAALLMMILSWLAFAFYCRWGFGRFLARLQNQGDQDGRAAGEYQRLILKFSVLAIFLFALDVYAFQIKYWLQTISFLRHLSVLQGLAAIMLFVLYLCTIWYFAHPAYLIAFQADIGRPSFIVSNVKLNLPIIFPWLLLSLAYDLISLSPWGGPDGLLGRPEGQVLFFACFLILLMIYMPFLIQTWWGCKPFPPSEKIRALEAFLKDKGLRYRDLLRWPIFEGRMMTAGVMGIVPRYRYLLVTDALMEILSMEELKAVLAHEIGHVKYRHMLFYLIFFLGYMFLMIGLFESDLYFLFSIYVFERFMSNVASAGSFYLLFAVPLLITMFVYFRFVMGFFMRQFERQADLYSAVTMGSPIGTISSLEKIAMLSGKTRDLPSWHHFSIKERVDYLWRATEDKRLVDKHHRFVLRSFAIFLICLIGLTYLLNFSSAKERLSYSVVSKVLNQQLVRDPANVALYESLALVYQKMGKYGEAINTYEEILAIDPDRAVALNNLAWILVTAPEKGLRDETRGLELARRAVALEGSAVFLDTLAEAHYANGQYDEAIRVIGEAISVARGGEAYYKNQLEKFMAARDERGHPEVR
jgi:Zn-dependent protease with chaperone function